MYRGLIGDIMVINNQADVEEIWLKQKSSWSIGSVN